MARIFLIRHGEPTGAWGLIDDPGLSERGRAQAAEAAEALAPLGKLILLSSPLRRCQETAAPVAHRFCKDVSIEPRVGEVVTPDNVADRRAWLAQSMAPGARWAELDPATRAWRDGALLAARAVPADAAVFTHFVAINAIVGSALGAPDVLVCRPGFASITELALDDGVLSLVKLGAQMQTEVR